MLFSMRLLMAVVVCQFLATTTVAAEGIPSRYHGQYAGAGQTCTDINGRLEVKAGEYFNYIQRKAENGQNVVDVHRCNVIDVREGANGMQMTIACTAVFKDLNVMRAFEPTVESWEQGPEGITIDGQYQYRRC